MNHIFVLISFISIFLVLQTGTCDGTDLKKHISTDNILMFSGYALLGASVFLGVSLCLCRNRKKKKESKFEAAVNKKVAAVEESDFINSDRMELKTKSTNRSSEMSSVSSESGGGAPSQTLVILTNSEVNGLKFEELLKAPAELIGRGKHGSTYKVLWENPRMFLTVKRIKGWEISSHDFKTRMRRLDQLKHPNVLPALAFYSSSQEKLLVFEFQNNGSLLKRLQGAQTGQPLEWSSRLIIASTIAESMAFMHHELKDSKIPHGNLKSSNILLKHNMDPCISEYGLNPASSEPPADFKEDVFGFGVILLELLTGKLVQNNEVIDLAKWVVSVLREEWTVEVFDRALIREGASEERMVSVLQVAVKCVNSSPEIRPSMNQVAMKINAIREEEERSMDVSLNVSIS